MSSDDDLRINTLHRFSKHSPRLTLQEYSHCEVPAGCGGVVLRWVDPEAGPSANITIGLSGEADTWLDGNLLEADTAPFAPGAHVLVFHLSKLRRWETSDATHLLTPPLPVSIVVRADNGPQRNADRELNRLGNAHPFRACWSTATFAAPPVGADFDDRAWADAEPVATATLAALPERLQRFFRTSEDLGRTLLQLGTAGPPIDEAWLRLTFSLDVTQ